jgi:hypothetical protein
MAGEERNNRDRDMWPIVGTAVRAGEIGAPAAVLWIAGYARKSQMMNH